MIMSNSIFDKQEVKYLLHIAPMLIQQTEVTCHDQIKKYVALLTKTGNLYQKLQELGGYQ